jgi:hypothetical protein
MNMYQHLMQHLERHVYKRGTNKGDAPANKGQRWRTSFRVVKHIDCMSVRLWRTDIIKAYPDGTFVIDTEGYYLHSTTVLRMNDALGYFLPHAMWMGSIKKFSLSQKIMHVKGKKYRFYDGMEFDADCNLIGEKKCFESRCIDKAQTKVFLNELKEAGFREVFNILWSQATLDDRFGSGMHRLEETITNPDKSDEWMSIIAQAAFGSGWGDNKACPQVAWSRIMQAAKRDMYVVLPTDIYEV